MVSGALTRRLIRRFDFTDTTDTKAGISSAGQRELGILGRSDPVPRLLRSEIMPPRHVRYHRTGAIASATIRPFSSSLHRRRRTTPVTSAWRRTIFVSSLPIFVSPLMPTIIMCT
jgi:hypothetical protein